MDLTKYGPFASVVGAASLLIAVFGAFALKAIGPLRRWTELGAGSPPFMVAIGPRLLAIVGIVASFLAINRANYPWFLAGAGAAALITLVSVRRFDSLRRRYVASVPLVGHDGKQLVGKHGPLSRSVVIGSEENLRPEASRALQAARSERGGISIQDFMSGYGAQRVNDPSALWDKLVLEDNADRIGSALTSILLFSVLALFLAALVFEVARV